MAHGFLGKHWQTLSDALGVRRYVVLGTSATAAAILTAAYTWLSAQPMMTWLPSVPIWAFFLIALLAILLFFALSHASDLRERLSPKIDITFEPRGPWISRVEQSHIPTADNPNNRAPSIWYSVKIVNLKIGTTIKRCRVALTKIEYWSNDRWTETEFASSQPLRWAESHDWYERIDLPHEETRLANVISVDPVHNKIFVKWPPPGWQVHDHIFDRLGRYRLTIVASPEEGQSALRQLIVDWSGDWEKVEVATE